MEDKENIMKTFRLFDEHNKYAGAEKWVLREGFLFVYQKSAKGLEREWRAGSQIVKYIRKEEI